MHPSFQAWRKEFSFSDADADTRHSNRAALRLLEQEFETPITEITELPDEAETQAELDEFTDQLALQVVQKLQQKNPETTGSQYSKTELLNDNRKLATQVRQLLAEREQLHMELAFYQQALPRFRHVLGGLYLKR